MAFRMDFRVLPRCCAKARSNSGNPCQQAAMKNGRCHWHGGASPIKHGAYSKMTQAAHSHINMIIAQARSTLSHIDRIIHDTQTTT